MIASRREFLKSAALAGAFAALPGAFLQGCAPKGPESELSVRIAIVGGGSAGLTMANLLRRRLKKALITVIDPAERHFYQPGFTFIGAGLWQPNDVWMREFDLMPQGVAWKQTRVSAIDPDRRVMALENGEKLPYDFLVLAPGIQENWSKIEGITRETLGQGNAHSIYDFEGASRTWTALSEFVDHGGRGVFTDTWTKHKCGGAPKKICLLGEHLARKRGKRSALSFNYFTASKALYDVPHYTPRLMKIYEERHVPITLNAKLTGVDTSAKRAHFQDKLSGRTWTEDYDFLHFAPPQSAPNFVKQSGLSWTEGKLAPDGWAATDKSTLVHLKYPNIVCLGDVAGIPTSKTSAAVRKQAPVAMQNLCDLIASRPPSATYYGYAACPIITDYGHVIMAEFDYAKKPVPSFPLNLLDTSRELRTGWFLKAHVLKPMYFKLMLKGLA